MNNKSEKVIRIKKGKKKYDYVSQSNKSKKINNKKTLDYIKSLVIPPAYENVIISLNPDDDVAYIGYDVSGREQRIYTKKHNEKVTKNKYCALSRFIKLFPKIERDINKLLKHDELTKEKTIAIILKIISLCYFRIGNIKYKKKYNSHGITTITKKHISEGKDKKGNKYIKIKFIGKKGVNNECKICDKQMVNILSGIYITKTKDDLLFRYNNKYNIRSDDINSFLKKYDTEFTSKIYRTYYANVKLLELLQKKEISNTISSRKKVIDDVIESVSILLHHTKAICKKKYIDNDIIEMYIEEPDKFKNNFIMTKNKNGLNEFLMKKC